MSDAAFFILMASVFGLVVVGTIRPGASVFSIQAGAATYSASCSIQ